MQWVPVPLPDPKKVKALEEALGVSNPLAQILVQRGFDDFDKAKSFFRPQLSALHNPFLMQDMEPAVARVQKALAQNEQIVVYGDYDVDGTTAVALMVAYLKTKTEKVQFYIPDRYTEGYGISKTGIDWAKSQKATLIIALDCGVKALEQIDYAQTLGIDFIICDHHTPGNVLPKAVAVLDPKRADCNYPYKELCGCGIGLKLVQALMTNPQFDEQMLLPYLDLVATAIAADIVPMTGENRILAYFGLQQFQKKPRLGLAPLLKNQQTPVTVSDLVFKIAPRINAAGRMKHGKYAVELLLADTPEKANQKALRIEEYNTERRNLDEQITQEALAQIKEQEQENSASTVVWSEHWHKGVIGIVASRLIENHYKPTVVLTKSGSTYTGSARSVKGFDLYSALVHCQDHLERFGGHLFAAGLTLHEQALEGFKAAFEQYVQQYLETASKTPSLSYDLEIGLDEIDLKLYRIIEQMAPFGPQHMRPIFRSVNCMDTGKSRLVGQDQKHLKLEAADANGLVVSGIGFGMGHHYDTLKKGTPFEMLYNVDLNTYNGFQTLQLKVKDLRFVP